MDPLKTLASRVVDRHRVKAAKAEEANLPDWAKKYVRTLGLEEHLEDFQRKTTMPLRSLIWLQMWTWRMPSDMPLPSEVVKDFKAFRPKSVVTGYRYVSKSSIQAELQKKLVSYVTNEEFGLQMAESEPDAFLRITSLNPSDVLVSTYELGCAPADVNLIEEIIVFNK
jgi:hypothetical protein